MKFALSLMVILASFSAIAADRAIYDLMYLPSAGTTYGITEGALLSGHMDGRSRDGDFTGEAFRQTLGHSLNDKFSLAGSLDYGRSVLNLDGSNKTITQGIGDPNLTARYRLSEESLVLDATLGAKISTGEGTYKIRSNSDNQYNNKDGSDAFSAGLQVGQKNDGFQWAGLAQFTRSLSGTMDDAGLNVNIRPHNEFFFKGELLNKLSEKSLFHSAASVEFVNTVKSSNGAELSTSEFRYNLGAEYECLVSQNLLLRAGVDYSGVNSAAYNNFYYFTFSGGVNYQF
jgi:hypothetical protein